MDDPNHTPPGTEIETSSESLQAAAFREAVAQDNIEWLNSNLEHDKTLLDTTFMVHRSMDGIEETFHVNALALASLHAQVLVVRVLLKHGASAETEIPNMGGTALHMASIGGNVEIARLLVNKKADVNQADRYGNTPLHLASEFGNLDAVTFLLDMGAQIKVVDKKDSTPFHLACASGALEVAKTLWARGLPSQLYDRNIYSNQPIHLAAINNCHNVMAWLLRKGASAGEPGRHRMNALQLACCKKSTETVSAILDDEDTDPSIIHTKNRYQLTPLLLACLNLCPEIVNTLLCRGALASDVDENQSSCYHQVVNGQKDFSKDHIEILQRLVTEGADIDQENRQGQSPLFLACVKGKADLVKCLLNLGASINGRKGRSPLLPASLDDDSIILEHLLEKKPDLSCRNNHGISPLALACRHGKVHNLKLLIAKGADITARSNHNHTPLCFSATNDHVKIMIEILKTPTYYPTNSLKRKLPSENDSCRIEIAKAMIRGFGSELEAVKITMMDSAEYVLFWAVRMNCWEVLQKYNECKPQAHSFSNLQGASWLHLASQYGHCRRIMEFFSHCNPQDKTRTGATALHLAAVNGSLETAEFLLNLISTQQSNPQSLTAKIDAILECDNYGESPLALSVKRSSGAHRDLASVFWREFEALGSLDWKRMVPSRTKARVLEALAQYERPGGEKVLKSLLEQWSSPNTTVTPDTRTALEWAVESKQSVVVWWLLSKGGHSSRSTMESATRLAHSLEGKVGRLIQDLLKSPPPLLDSVANPNDDQPPAIPEPTQDKEEIPLLTIVDIHQKGTATMPRYVKANIHDVIYEPDYMGGPSAIIERAPKTVGLRDLESLKVQMEDAEQEDQKDRDHGVENLLMDVTNLWSNPQKSNYGVEKPKVRWIHLPANKASNVLMRKTYCANYIIASSNAGSLYSTLARLGKIRNGP
ncbi:hypothetical protein FPOAC2_00230 [Fusarium poae]